MNMLIERLEEKWGAFERDEYYLKQCDMSNGRCASYLNVLFNPIQLNEYEFVEKMLDCKLHPDLKKFYKKNNGIMLFFESLRIYGLETGKDAIYDSCDIVSQNINEGLQYIKEEFENMIIFGYYSSCLFCYDKIEMGLFYVINTKTEEVIHKFNSIEELLKYYVDYLINEYDINGKKIHYNPEYEGLPMANISTEII